MQLQLRPDTAAPAKISGLLIRGEAPSAWLHALKGTGISLDACEAYAIPGSKPNSIWGCLLITEQPDSRKLPPTVTFVTTVGARLLIPAFAKLYPAASDEELQRLISGQCLLHPETGLVLLESPLDWKKFLTLSEELPVRIRIPAAPVFMPAAIKRFEVAAPSPEEQLQAVAQRISPDNKKFDDKPLNALERLKLALYRQLFSKADGTSASEKGRILRMLERIAERLGVKPVGIERMQEDFESLEKRNASEVDKLLDMLRKNPEEALRYAIPLGDGTGRGTPGALRLAPLWSSFSLFGNLFSNNAGGGGGGVIPESQHNKLYEEYSRTAAHLISQGAYEKAAFVYLKLLKNYQKAADALIAGNMFAEAAAIHLKYTHNKLAAADCYVKANMLSKAIELYEELGKTETVGDLYLRLNRRDDAMTAYQKVVDGYVDSNQLLKAANIKRDKMADLPASQELLLRGWHCNSDAYNCLNVYFSNIDDPVLRWHAIQNIYAAVSSPQKAGYLLAALKKEVQREEALLVPIREIALELIASRASSDPSVIAELRFFNKGNGLIMKDIMRYRTAGKR